MLKEWRNVLAMKLRKLCGLWAMDPLDLLGLDRTALFCSQKYPGDAILKAMDRAQRWRESVRSVISGFHYRELFLSEP